MTFKTLTVILCSLVMICPCKIGVEATVFTTSLNSATWESARNRCALRNETFATTSLSRTNGVLIVNNTDLKLDSKQTLWVGHVKQFNYFTFKGCVNESTLTITHRSKARLGHCYDNCNTPYVGLRTKEWDCFCINYTPNWNTLVDCLDHTIMIYEHLQPEPFSIKTEPGQEDIQMCGQIWVQANTTREIKMKSCQTPSQTWCEKDSTISMEDKCNSEENTWKESIHCCTASRLPQLTPKTMKDITFNTSKTTKTNIWTALLRESIVIKHKRLQGVLNPESKCAYVMKSKSGEIELHFDNCTTKRKFICSSVKDENTSPRATQTDPAQREAPGSTPAGASPTTTVVTSISTSSVSSTFSSSMSTEGSIDIISGAFSKDEEKTQNYENTSPRATQTDLPQREAPGSTPAGSSPTTGVVTSISTSSLSSTLSSSMSTEGSIDIISGAFSKDEEKTRNYENTSPRATQTDPAQREAPGSTPAGASPTTSVVTSIPTSSLSSTFSSSMPTEGSIDIISGASSKDEEKTQNWDPLVSGIFGAVVGVVVIIIVVFQCWKRSSKRRKTVATTDQVVDGQEESLPQSETEHTYAVTIEASVMTRPDSNNYDVAGCGYPDEAGKSTSMISRAAKTNTSDIYDKLHQHTVPAQSNFSDNIYNCAVSPQDQNLYDTTNCSAPGRNQNAGANLSENVYDRAGAFNNDDTNTYDTTNLGTRPEVGQGSNVYDSCSNARV